MADKLRRLRRAKRGRSQMRRQAKCRLTITRTPRHISVQLIKPMPKGDEVLASASTMEQAFKKAHQGFSGNITAAVAIGKMIAERALAAGVKDVAFDRSGYMYHGRVKALADAAREGGMEF